jgi:hypothetical protein
MNYLLIEGRGPDNVRERAMDSPMPCDNDEPIGKQVQKALFSADMGDHQTTCQSPVHRNVPLFASSNIIPEQRRIVIHVTSDVESALDFFARCPTETLAQDRVLRKYDQGVGERPLIIGRDQ